MVWGIIGPDGPKHLCWPGGSINSPTYIDAL